MPDRSRLAKIEELAFSQKVFGHDDAITECILDIGDMTEETFQSSVYKAGNDATEYDAPLEFGDFDVSD